MARNSEDALQLIASEFVLKGLEFIIAKSYWISCK